VRSDRRAVIRWAWRLLRRDGRQQLFMTLLLIVAVGAAVCGAAMAVNAQHDNRSLFGDADAVVRVDGRDATVVRDAIATVPARFGDAEAIWHTPLEVPGSSAVVDLRGQEPGGALGGPTLSLVDGRYPATRDEVAITDGAADLFRASVGGSIDVTGEPRTVVGLVENPLDLDSEFVLELPDDNAPSEFVSVLTSVDGREITPGGIPGQVGLLRLDGLSDSTAPVVVMAIAAVLALVGLVAAAGFLVAALRRQRQLGMLAALGGSQRDLRLVMVANGVAVGLVAAVVGTVGGTIVWFEARHAAERAAAKRIARFDLPWTLVASTAVLAVATAAFAAWWPARQVSRLPIMTALSGRPTRPRPVHRPVVVAIALVAIGVALVVVAAPTGDNPRPVLLCLGLVAVVLGAVAISPATVRILGVVAKRMPFAPRLALRDLARYQSRSAASLAAITLGLGICVAIMAVAAANVYPASEGNLSSRQLLVTRGAVAPTDGGAVDPDAARVLDALGAGVRSVPLDLAINPDATGDRREPISVGEPIDESSTRFLGPAYVATPEVLAYFGIDATGIDPSTDLLLAQDRTVALVDVSVRPDPGSQAVTTQVVDLPMYSAAPFALVTESAMQRHGWTPLRAAWFAESVDELTSTQVDAARAAAADVGLRVEVRDAQDALASLRDWTTAGGAAVALAIVAMSVGLVRGEAAHDMRTLTATGAAARTHRAVTASTAAALAVLGVGLGMVGAYIFLVASYRSELEDLTPLPVRQLAVLAVGVPVVAALGGWLLAGRRPGVIARRALD
jgi:putative ABC transport system permease protein